MNPGMPYRPSNGTDGECFQASWCDQCERSYQHFVNYTMCPIPLRAQAFGVDDRDYPREWQYDQIGRPSCTAFVPLGDQLPPDRCEHTGDLFAGSTETEQQ